MRLVKVHTVKSLHNHLSVIFTIYHLLAVLFVFARVFRGSSLIFNKLRLDHTTINPTDIFQNKFCVIKYARKSCRRSVEFDEKHIIQILYSLRLSWRNASPGNLNICAEAPGTMRPSTMHLHSGTMGQYFNTSLYGYNVAFTAIQQ